MPGLVLTKQYLTGIQLIDAQHKTLVEMINDLADALNKGIDRELTGDILRKLIEYTESHFKIEEAMMREHDYPDYPSHVAGHRKLIKRVMTFEDMFKKGIPNIGPEILSFLQEWLFNHILKTDMAYVPCITGRHVAPSAPAETGSGAADKIVGDNPPSANDAPAGGSFNLTDDLLTGVDEIDAQHKKLFELVDKLNLSMARRESRDIIGQTIDELVDYTRTHFAAEEAMMARCHYPRIEQHKKAHEKLLSRVHVFKNMYARGTPNIESEILCFLKDWLLNHISKTDMDYVPSTREQREAVVS